MPGAEKGVGRAANAHTLRCGSEHQRLSLRMTGYKRLFRIDMLAGFDNLHADRCVSQWDGKIDDDLDFRVGEESIHRHGLYSVLRRFFLCRFHAHVRDVLHPYLLRPGRAFQVGMADVAAANDANVCLCHNAVRLPDG